MAVPGGVPVTMYPDEFEYHAPETVDDAVSLLEEGGFDVEVLAGGHSLLPTMKTGFANPETIVDIGNIDGLSGIERTDDELRIGALTTYNEIARSEIVGEDAAVLQMAAGEIGDEQVRNRGTIGGNLAHADPASDLPAAALVTEAQLVVAGPDGTRTLEANEFYFGMYATALGEEELVTEIRVPRRQLPTVSSYTKKASPSSGYAIIGVAASLDIDDDTVMNARIAANGVFDHAVRLDAVEEHLEGNSPTTDAIEAASSVATQGFDDDEFLDDMQASSEFRAHLLEVYTQRTLADAVEN